MRPTDAGVRRSDGTMTVMLASATLDFFCERCAHVPVHGILALVWVSLAWGGPLDEACLLEPLQRRRNNVLLSPDSPRHFCKGEASIGESTNRRRNFR